MKYTIATVLLAAFGVCLLGASEIHTQRAGQQAALMQGTVSVMSQQQLALARRQCEPQSNRSAAAARYCVEVQRILESEPLQFVVRPRQFASL